MNTQTKKQLLLSTLLTGAVIGSAAPAFAQDADVDEIVVTGSRIAKKDFVSNSPVATVSAEQFALTGTVNTESLLNTLPQTVPGLDRTSNNPGGGIATVDLRGLGSARTLVLVDGKRMTPTTQGGTVDINNIPTALIENVEVVTGGASAVYGSDAVAGVVNFIMKDDFEGVEASAGYQSTDKGDAGLFSTDVTFGANFADNRGNATVSLSYASRDALFQGDRDFSTFAQFDDTDADGNPILIDGGSSGVPGTSIFAGGFGTFSPDSFGIVFDQDGSVRPFRTGETNDFYNYAPVNYIQLPQERYQMTSLARFEINEHAEVYGKAFYSFNNVPQQLAPTPIFQTSTFSLDNNPFITPEAQLIISNAIGLGVDTDGDGIDDEARALVRRRLEEVGPRVADSSFNSFQFQTGIRGETFVDGWDYDVYFQAGRVNGSEAQLGNVNRGRFNQALLLADADGDGNVDVDANGNPTCSDPSTNGSTLACAPLNIFGAGNISQDAADFLKVAVASTLTYDQNIVAGNLTGDLGGLRFTDTPIGLAFGGEYIENRASFNPSQDLAAGTIAGFNGQPASGGEFDVYSVYGEAYVPLIEGKPGIQNLALELAARVSDYSTAGTSETYKVAGEWEPIDQLRFRASYNTATRAPSIGELFAPQSEGFPGASDPCSASGAPAGGISAALAALCVATGVPTGSVGTPAINPAAGQIRALSGGNPDLDVEKAKTLTVGFVARPNAIPGLTLSVDYFDIEITDAIGAFGGGTNNILDICYNNAENGGAGSVFCDAINRRADGTIDFVSELTQNIAVRTLDGFDIQADYTTDLGGFLGQLDLVYLGTITADNTSIPFAGGDPIECAGRFGADCGEPDPNYRHRMTARVSNNNLTSQLAWRFVGNSEDDNADTVFAVDEIGNRSYFDASTTWDVSDNLGVTFGVNNIFDKEPPILGDNQEQANTYPATYDVFGRTFFGKLTTRF